MSIDLKELKRLMEEGPADGDEFIEIHVPRPSGDKEIVRCRKILFCAAEVEGQGNAWAGGAAGKLRISDMVAASTVIEQTLDYMSKELIKKDPLGTLQDMAKLGKDIGKEDKAKDLEQLIELLHKLTGGK